MRGGLPDDLPWVSIHHNACDETEHLLGGSDCLRLHEPNFHLLYEEEAGRKSRINYSGPSSKESDCVASPSSP